MTYNQQAYIRPNPRGDWPEVHPTAYVDPSAQVIGRVQIGPSVFVGPNAVIRADECDTDGEVKAIIVEAESNVQDDVIIHALAGSEVTIGQRTSLSHGAVVHGPCRISEGGFIGFGAVFFTSQLGRGVFVASRAVVENVNVPADTFIPAFTFISQDRINRLRKTEPKERSFMADVVSEVMTILAGLAKMHFGRFMLALSLGSIPVGFALAWVGETAGISSLLLLVLTLVPAIAWCVYVAATGRRRRTLRCRIPERRNEAG